MNLINMLSKRNQTQVSVFYIIHPNILHNQDYLMDNFESQKNGFPWMEYYQ